MPYSRSFSRWQATVSAVLVLAAHDSALADTNDLDLSVNELKKLPLEELINIPISGLSRRPQLLSDSPSAAQVITSEDIHRSAATTLPEALRLAPNLEVDQIDSRNWAISARGFNTTTSDKMQVMIDGRSIYTPLFAGVFWDVQQVMLDDVDRIEIVSGPGASLWGANAVNGVINVVSKSADQTQGFLLSGGGGSFMNGYGAVRYGDKIGQDLYFRVYGMGFDHDSAMLPSGVESTNDWRLGQGGFRADWMPTNGDIVTLQGDFYGGWFEQPAPGDTQVNGQNVLSRWTHPTGDESASTLQMYWDRTWRTVPDTFAEDLNTVDIDYQYRTPIGERQQFLAGTGYRLYDDNVHNSASLAFLPPHRNLQLFSGFAQDEIAMVKEKLFLTLGTKLEHNDYSGFEVEPTARLAWKPSTNQLVWAAVSRAVRMPSRLDADAFAPGQPPYLLQGAGDEFESEKVIAYELGYRRQMTTKLSGSVSLFFDDYSDVRSINPIPGTTNQFVIQNKLAAQSYGAEFSLNYQALDWWRLRGGYTYFHKDIFHTSKDLNAGTAEGNDPHHWFVLQSMMDLPRHCEFDTVVRYQDNLDQLGPSVPGFVALDLRFAWHVTRNLELSVSGTNLLDNQHPEFSASASTEEIPRSVFGKVTWRF
jgi:iron complex outermembrane receptor protein